MTRPAVGTLAPVVAVDGSELAGQTLQSLIGMSISRGLRLPSRARLEFVDDGFALSADGTFTVGRAITIKTADGKPLFTGEMTGVELDVERGAPNLTVIADDPAYKLTLGNKVRTFVKMSFSEMVDKVVRELGLKVNITQVAGQQPYVLQTDSDFGFVSEIADRVGYDWWVDEVGTFQFHPMGSASGEPPTVGWDVNRPPLSFFSVRASALHPTKVTVNGWDPETSRAVTVQNTPVKFTPTSNFLKPFLSASSLKPDSSVSSAYRMFSDGEDGARMANSAATVALSTAVTAEGVCPVNPAIRVGHQVNVEGVGPASGMYYVTEVEHSYSARGFDTRFVAGDRLPTGLVDTLATPVNSSFRQESMVVGVVTSTSVDGAPKGYVKVKYPSLGNEIESAAARVVSLGAGQARGMTFLPEVNDEVIVAFEGGDVARPLVLGGLYSAKRTAHDYGLGTGGQVDKRQIVSRLGHVIELGDGDSDANQHICLTLAGGQHFVKLGKDGLSATVPSGQPVSIKAGETMIEFDKQGNITMSGQKVTIKATGDVEISGMNVKVKANAAVEASGANAKVSGSASAEISAGGMTAVKGATVKIN